MQYKTKKIKVTTPDSPLESPYLPSPCFNVTGEQMPEIKNWQVGQKYQLVIDVLQASKSLTKDGHADARLEVVGYKYLPAKEIEDMTDEEFEKEQAKGLSANK